MTIQTLQPVLLIGDATTRDQVASAIDPQEAPAADEATRNELLMLEIDAQSNVRWDKIASLRTCIVAGTYRIPSTEIASRIIDTLLG